VDGLGFNELVFNCADPAELARFWSAVLGCDIVRTTDRWAALEPFHGVKFAFQKVPELKSGPNRLHVDLEADDEEAAAREIEALGATRLRLSDKPDDPYVVLADPEGNEFCVVRRMD
jgi:catechol 2,3-dioxygenase-like lactoylglutathione lyase family enzyme